MSASNVNVNIKGENVNVQTQLSNVKRQSLMSYINVKYYNQQQVLTLNAYAKCQMSGVKSEYQMSKCQLQSSTSIAKIKRQH